MPPNTTVDLITLKDYELYTGQTSDDENIDQEQIARLITSSSELFTGPDFADRKFLQVADVVEFEGTGSLNHFVRYTPIAASPVLTIDWWNATAWELATVANYPRQIDLTEGIIRMTQSGFRRGVRWRVSYTGGYADESAVPLDIKEAICQLVVRSLGRATGKEGVTSESAENQSVSLNLNKAATDKIALTAHRYKRIVAY